MERFSIIGDDIALGYLPYLRDVVPKSIELQGVPPFKFQTGRLSMNGGSSHRILVNVEKWLVERPANYIAWNCGHYDIKDRVSLADYELNLGKIANRLRTGTRAPLFWIASTPIRIDEDRAGMNTAVKEYNKVARGIMERFRITVIDVYSTIVLGIPEYCLQNDGRHMMPRGNELIAEKIWRDITGEVRVKIPDGKQIGLSECIESQKRHGSGG